MRRKQIVGKNDGRKGSGFYNTTVRLLPEMSFSFLLPAGVEQIDEDKFDALAPAEELCRMASEKISCAVRRLPDPCPEDMMVPSLEYCDYY